MCGIGTDWLQEAAKHPLASPASESPHSPKRALIIFVKNPALGKVKTRLAKTIGEQAALDAYLQMLAYMRATAVQVEVDRVVYYADYIDEADAWSRPAFSKALQATGDVGERMAAAFADLFAQGYGQVALVGSDFLDIQVQHLNQAYRALDHHDCVLGPAQDGGYYLVGMRALQADIFQNRTWSHAKVLAEALASLQKAGKTVALLPELSDIDEAEDWFAALERLQARAKLP
jgi:uncharacterized protein